MVKGKRLHLKRAGVLMSRSFQSGWDSNVFVGTSLVDMYAKCGSMEDAYRVFNKMSSRDAVTWTAMLSGHAGKGRRHWNYFDKCNWKLCGWTLLLLWQC